MSLFSATALNNVKSAITRLATDRATIGAYQSRLNFTVEQLQVSRENLSAASSRMQDVDVAEESTQYARYNILVQAGTAMLAQAAPEVSTEAVQRLKAKFRITEPFTPESLIQKIREILDAG